MHQIKLNQISEKIKGNLRKSNIQRKSNTKGNHARNDKKAMKPHIKLTPVVIPCCQTSQSGQASSDTKFFLDTLPPCLLRGLLGVSFC